MGLFGRLFGRERRDRRRAGLSTTSGPPPKPVPTATYLPDWSEYWLTTTREQAGGSPYPYPYDTEPPARTQIGVRDLAEGAGPDGASVDGGLASGGMESVRPPAGHYGVNLAPVNVLPGEDPPFASDDQAVTYEAPPLTPVTHLTDADPHVDRTAAENSTYEAVHRDQIAGDRWVPAEPVAAVAPPALVEPVVAEDPSPAAVPSFVVDEGAPVASTFAAPQPAGPTVDRPSEEAPHFERSAVDDWLMSGTVTIDMAPLAAVEPTAAEPASPGSIGHTSVEEPQLVPPSVDQCSPAEPETSDVSAEVPTDLPPPVAASVVLDVPAPAHWSSGTPAAPAEPLPTVTDELVLDVRDSPESEADPEPVQPNVVLGFGDGSTQQLDGDDPDVRTFHELAAALTSAPRHRR